MVKEPLDTSVRDVGRDCTDLNGLTFMDQSPRLSDLFSVFSSGSAGRR